MSIFKSLINNIDLCNPMSVFCIKMVRGYKDPCFVKWNKYFQQILLLTVSFSLGHVLPNYFLIMIIILPFEVLLN